MLGKQSGQRGLWEADSLYIDHVGRGSFYGLLASMRGQLFEDEEFAELYCADNGRDSVPSSLLVTALLLQTHDRVSDAEAKQRADFDIRWKVALGIEVEDRPFAKSTLQLFQARLILHEKVREVFERSLRFARETGYLKSRRMKVALDTTYILGRVAVKDTYNLLSDGVVELMRVLSEVERSDLVEWAAANGYQRYVGSSVKGDACIDWDDKKARAALLGRIVGDADRLLELSRRAQGLLDEDSAGRQRIVQGSELLGQLLLQDVERTEDGVCLKEGVSRDRMVSVHDPEMRHGHKSSSKRFDGHKASVAVDTDSQVITAVDVLPGNASDNVGALELVERSEEGTVSAVEETIGDVAYGDGGTRRLFADAGRTLIAKLPRRPDSKRFPKEDFEIDLESGTCTCPAGHTDPEVVQDGYPDRQNGSHSPVESLLVRRCGLWSVPTKERCVGSARGSGRTVRLHPQEALLQQARALQKSEGYSEYRQRRVVVEHRLARLVQLGMRQARYFGRVKTLFQLLMAATVANLTLVVGRVGMMGEAAIGSRFSYFSLTLISTTWRDDIRIGRRRLLILATSVLPSQSLFRSTGFSSALLGRRSLRLLPFFLAPPGRCLTRPRRRPASAPDPARDYMDEVPRKPLHPCSPFQGITLNSPTRHTGCSTSVRLACPTGVCRVERS